jgi:hypothetical protein
MNPLATKLAFSALVVATLTTPAFAARARGHVAQRPVYDVIQDDQQQVGTYPNGATRSGSADSVQSGAEFNLQKNNVPE